MGIPLILIVLTLVLIGWLYRYSKSSKKKASKVGKQFLLGLGLAGLLLLTVTGRLNWLIAALPAALLLVHRLYSWSQYALLARQLWHHFRPLKDEQQGAGGSVHHVVPSNLSKEEALKVLGLKGKPDRATILAAHKRLIQRCHPDRQGSNYLASLINIAKDTLIKRD